MDSHPPTPSDLTDHIEDLAEALLGTPDRRGEREWRYDRERRLTVVVTGARRGQWYDHTAKTGGAPLALIAHVRGCSPGEAETWALARFGVASVAARGAPAVPDGGTDARRARARAIAAQAGPIERSDTVRRYLHGNGIGPAPSTARDRHDNARAAPPVSAVRCTDDPDHLEGDADAALVAVATDAGGEVHAVQRIYVRRDGSPARVEAVFDARRTDGSPRGAAVRLPGPGDGPLVLCEQLENALALWHATGHEVWATLGPMGNAPAPSWRTLIVAQDADAPGSPADDATTRAVESLAEMGGPVWVARPDAVERHRSGFNPNEGFTFLDLLRRGGRRPVREAVGAAACRVAGELPPPEITEAVPLDQARTQLTQDVRGWFDVLPDPPGDDVVRAQLVRPALFRVTPGLGKTETALEAAVRWLTAHPGAQGAILVPEHELGAEMHQRVQAAIERHGSAIAVAVWYGAEQVCDNPDLLKAVRMNGGGADHACRVCPLQNTCPYPAQKTTQADLWIGAHALLRREPPGPIEPRRLGFVVIDESPVDALLGGTDAPFDVALDALDTPREIDGDLDAATTDELTTIGRDVRAALDAVSGRWLDRDALPARVTAARCRRAHRLEWDRVPSYPALSADMSLQEIQEAGSRHGARFARAVKAGRIWQLLADWLEGPQARCPWLELRTETAHGQAQRQVRAVWREAIAPGWRAPTVMLDATADPALVRHWMPNVDVHEIHARLPRGSGIRHLYGRSTTQRALTGRGSANDAARAARLRGALARLLETWRGALIAQKDVVEHIQQDHPRAVATSAGLGHFNGLRGQNALERVHHLVVAGRTLPKASAVARMASAVTGRWIDPDPNYARVPRRLWRPDATPAGVVRVHRHPDPDGERVRQQAAKAEVSQAIHRARPAVRGGADPVHIDVLVSDVAPAVPVTDTAAFEGALPSAVELAAARGIVPDTTKHLQRVVADVHRTPAALRQAVRRGDERVTPLCGDSHRGLSQIRGGTGVCRGCGAGFARWRLRLDGERKRFEADVDPSYTEAEIAGTLGAELAHAERIAAPKPLILPLSVDLTASPAVVAASGADRHAIAGATVSGAANGATAIPTQGDRQLGHPETDHAPARVATALDARGVPTAPARDR